MRAVSIKGRVPQGYIDRDEAEAACENAGKRLCTDDEWIEACKGKNPTQYPYGDDHKDGFCNDTGVSSFNLLYGPGNNQPPAASAYTRENMNDERLNQMEGTVAPSGKFAKCKNSYGVFDMVGNLHEWTAATSGTFRGGYYLDTHINGDGCDYRTTAHDHRLYHDYSTGFPLLRGRWKEGRRRHGGRSDDGPEESQEETQEGRMTGVCVRPLRPPLGDRWTPTSREPLASPGCFSQDPPPPRGRTPVWGLLNRRSSPRHLGRSVMGPRKETLVGYRRLEGASGERAILLDSEAPQSGIRLVLPDILPTEKTPLPPVAASIPKAPALPKNVGPAPAGMTPLKPAPRRSLPTIPGGAKAPASSAPPPPSTPPTARSATPSAPPVRPSSVPPVSARDIDVSRVVASRVVASRAFERASTAPAAKTRSVPPPVPYRAREVVASARSDGESRRDEVDASAGSRRESRTPGKSVPPPMPAMAPKSVPPPTPAARRAAVKTRSPLASDAPAPRLGSSSRPPALPKSIPPMMAAPIVIHDEAPVVKGPVASLVTTAQDWPIVPMSAPGAGLPPSSSRALAPSLPATPPSPADEAQVVDAPSALASEVVLDLQPTPANAPPPPVPVIVGVPQLPPAPMEPKMKLAAIPRAPRMPSIETPSAILDDASTSNLDEDPDLLALRRKRRMPIFVVASVVAILIATVVAILASRWGPAADPREPAAYNALTAVRSRSIERSASSTLTRRAASESAIFFASRPRSDSTKGGGVKPSSGSLANNAARCSA